MIRSFAHRGLKRFFENGDGSRLPPDMIERISNILAVLNVANDIRDMDIHSFRLHPLRQNLRGYWAVTVRANWRIIFRFDEGNAFDVDLVDYH